MTVSLVAVVRAEAKLRALELTPAVLEVIAGLAGMIHRGQLPSEPKQPGHPATDAWACAALAVSHARKIGISLDEVKRCLREDFVCR